MNTARCTRDELRALVAAPASQPGGLMPALHAVLERFGWIPPDAIGVLADACNLSVAEVHGVISFYDDFHTEQPSGPVVAVCAAEACQARGANAVLAEARSITSAGVPVEIRHVFCLGNCALGPSVLASGRLHARVDARALRTIVAGAIVTEAIDAGAIDAGAIDAAEGSLPMAMSTAIAPPPAAMQTVYISCDAAARSVGADDVARAFLARGVHVVRTGSRGMLWAEPVVEVESPDGRCAFGPVHPDHVDGLIAALAAPNTTDRHPLSLGLIEAHPWMARQHRLTFRNVGVIDPRSTADAAANGAMDGLRIAHTMEPAEVIRAITESGLRGRGGAAFPAGIKWGTVANTKADHRYVVCNADEGDSGTFADRMLIEGDPFTLLEGMAIAGYAVGATEGYVYVRSEYPAAIAALRHGYEAARKAGWLGADVLGSGQRFDVHVRVGAGSYVCGEETAMLESLEGRRGVVRAKPPLPAVEGLFGRPTLVHNVLTLAAVPAILTGGAAAHAALGVTRSRGTFAVQLGGNVRFGGLLEVPFGLTVRELVEDIGGGTLTGRPIGAVQIGGPLGAYLPPSGLDVALEYEALTQADAMLGHGGIVVFDDTVDMRAQARFAMEFCALESCGKCTPCRIGAQRGVEVIDRIANGADPHADIDLLLDLCDVMADGSLCAMGGLTPLPVRSALRQFSEHFLTNATPTHEEVRP